MFLVKIFNDYIPSNKLITAGEIFLNYWTILGILPRSEKGLILNKVKVPPMKSIAWILNYYDNSPHPKSQ